MRCDSRISLTSIFPYFRLLAAVFAFTLVNGTMIAFAQTQQHLNVADKSKGKSSSPVGNPANFKQESDEVLSQCRTLFNQQNYSTAESLLRKELSAVRKYGSNDSTLPKYLGVIGSCCYFQKRYKEAVAFIQEALKANDSLPSGKSITHTALFSNHAYMAMSLQELEQYAKATEHYRKAVDLAEGLPAIDRNWLRLCYQGLIYCLRRTGKYDEVLKYKERMSKIK